MPEALAGMKATQSRRFSLPAHGFPGLAIMLLGAGFMPAKIKPVCKWFTPVQWAGDIVLLGAHYADPVRCGNHLRLAVGIAAFY